MNICIQMYIKTTTVYTAISLSLTLSHSLNSFLYFFLSICKFVWLFLFYVHVFYLFLSISLYLYLSLSLLNYIQSQSFCVNCAAGRLQLSPFVTRSCSGWRRWLPRMRAMPSRAECTGWPTGITRASSSEDDLCSLLVNWTVGKGQRIIHVPSPKCVQLSTMFSTTKPISSGFVCLFFNTQMQAFAPWRAKNVLNVLFDVADCTTSTQRTVVPNGPSIGWEALMNERTDFTWLSVSLFV